MSGIVGVFHRDGRPVDEADLRAMVDILAHRGPDGAGIWCEGSVGLGHRMLHTTPESLHETLPWTNERGDLTITADARIDNRDELFRRLRLDDRVRAEIADSQLILAAYEKWGERCPEYLLGDFAFAIWDGRERRLFCARDHFGVRPFYYYSSHQLFAFASEIKALLTLPHIPQRLNELRAVAHVLNEVIDNTATFYCDLLRLPPRHSIKLCNSEKTWASYWSLDPSLERQRNSDDEYAEAFLELFRDAVQSRLRTASPIGTLLSGGLDSSSITCMAKMLLNNEGNKEPLNTFSLAFEKLSQCDERSYAGAITASSSIKAHYVWGDRIGPLSGITSFQYHMDQPASGGNVFVVWALNKAAHSEDVRVILDGFDGDTVVSHGTGRLMELARARHWLQLIQEAGAYAHNFGRSPRKVVWHWLWNYGIRSLYPIRAAHRLVRQTRELTRGNSSPVKQQNGILTQEAIKLLSQTGCSTRMAKSPRNQREAHYRRLSWEIFPAMLETYDGVTSAYSIERRFPFWDRRLVEFCLSLPSEQKLYDGWDRVILRRAMTNILPEKIRWRRGKTNMTPNFEHGLLQFEQTLMKQALLNYSEVMAPYVNLSELRRIYQSAVTKQATSEEMALLWRAVSLTLWLQQSGVSLS